MGASFLLQCTGLWWGRGRVCGLGPVMTQITVQCAAQVHLSISFPSHPVSAPGTWGVEWSPVFVVQIKTSTGRLCHTNGVHCAPVYSFYLWKIWHHVPQKNTLLLSFLSLECFEVPEHRTSYSKLLEWNWRWLSLVLLTAVFAVQAPGCFSLT